MIKVISHKSKGINVTKRLNSSGWDRQIGMAFTLCSSDKFFSERVTIFQTILSSRTGCCCYIEIPGVVGGAPKLAFKQTSSISSIEYAQQTRMASEIRTDTLMIFAQMSKLIYLHMHLILRMRITKLNQTSNN